MATLPAATLPAGSPASPAADPAPRPLWQVPVFFLGLGALAAVWFLRPLWPDTPHSRLDRDLAAVRLQLARPDSDPEQVVKVAQRAHETAEQLSQHIGEAALLLGTAYVRQAQRTDRAWASTLWDKARQTLDQAERTGVPEKDRPALKYQQVKVGFHTGGDLGLVIQQLELSAAQADNRVEAYTLLTQAYLRLPQPDVARALDANRRLRDVAEASEADLAAAKLQGGELLLRLGKPDEARKTLERIGEGAPPTLAARARLLRARSYQDEGKWGEAANLYEAALVGSRGSAAEQAHIYYHLGLCYRKREQPEALKAWEECVKLQRDPESSAAALHLAELYVQANAPAKALGVLQKAVARVGTPAEWANALVGLQDACAVFERSAAALRRAGQSELALQLTAQYVRLAGPLRAWVLHGEMAAEAARLREERAARSTDAKQQLGDRARARTLWASAGFAYTEAARYTEGRPTEQGEHLWAAANQYLAGQHYKEAAARIEQFLKADRGAARMGEAWYRLGEAHHALLNTPAARDAYQKCLLFRTRFEYLARHQLAQYALAAGEIDAAAEDLKQNLRLMRYDPDREALEKTLFALGRLLYTRREYREALQPLEEALGKFKDHPEAIRARYQLADSYRQIAAQENQNVLLHETMSREARLHFQAEHRKWLEKAAAEFAKLDEALENDRARARDHLTDKEQLLVPFIAARCLFDLGKYEESLQLYDRLIQRYAGQQAEVYALGQAISCHTALRQEDKVRQRLLQIEQALPRLEPAQRRVWEEWAREVGKELKGLETP